MTGEMGTLIDLNKFFVNPVLQVASPPLKHKIVEEDWTDAQ